MKAFSIGVLAVLFLPIFLMGVPPSDGTGAERIAVQTGAKAAPKHQGIGALRTRSRERLAFVVQEPRVNSPEEAADQLKKRLADHAARSKSEILEKYELHSQLRRANEHLAALRSLSAPDLGANADSASESPTDSGSTDE